MQGFPICFCQMDPFDLKYLPLALMGVGDMTKSFNKICIHENNISGQRKTFFISKFSKVIGHSPRRSCELYCPQKDEMPVSSLSSTLQDLSV